MQTNQFRHTELIGKWGVFTVYTLATPDVAVCGLHVLTTHVFSGLSGKRQMCSTAW